MFMEWEVSGIINKMLPVLHLHPIALWLNSLERICSSGLSCLQQVCQLQLWLANAFCHNNRNEKMSEGVLWLERAEKLLLVESMGDYDIKKVCDQLAMSYESFRHRFKILAGISPGKFCAQKRIEESARMIAETNFSFKKIAYILGFCDEYHFSKVFKKIMGIPPGVWRKQFFK
jgi:AraC-like DNA-binding protein